MSNILEFRKKVEGKNYTTQDVISNMKSLSNIEADEEKIIEDLAEIENMAMVDTILCSLSKFVIRDSEKVINSNSSGELVSYLSRCRGNHLLCLVEQLLETEEGRGSIKRNSAIVKQALIKYDEATKCLIRLTEEEIKTLKASRSKFSKALKEKNSEFEIVSVDPFTEGDDSINDDEKKVIAEIKREEKLARREEKKESFKKFLDRLGMTV